MTVTDRVLRALQDGPGTHVELALELGVDPEATHEAVARLARRERIVRSARKVQLEGHPRATYIYSLREHA